MTKRDLWLIGIWALASAGVTTALMMPAALNAVDTPVAQNAGEIALPALKTNGCEVSVRWLTDARVKQTAGLNTTLAAGEMPKFQLVARNPSEEPAEVQVKVAVWTRDPINMASRVGPMERDSYSEYSSISLKPGETKTVVITPKTKLVPGAGGTIRLTAGGPEVAKADQAQANQGQAEQGQARQSKVASNTKARRAAAPGLVVARYLVEMPANDKTASLQQAVQVGSQSAVTKVNLAQVAVQQSQN